MSQEFCALTTVGNHVSKRGALGPGSRADQVLGGKFPPSPVVATSRLTPITTWVQTHEETKATNVEFDALWYDHVNCGVASFFRWTGDVRATVLVVWDDNEPILIECRKRPDELMGEVESASAVEAVMAAIRHAGLFRSVLRQLV